MTTGAYDDWGVSSPSSRGHHSSIAQDARRIITSLDKSRPKSDSRDVACQNCGTPFDGREGDYVLKYFLLGKRGNRGANTASPRGLGWLLRAHRLPTHRRWGGARAAEAAEFRLLRRACALRSGRHTGELRLARPDILVMDGYRFPQFAFPRLRHPFRTYHSSFLCFSVIPRAAEVVNSGRQVSPHHGIRRAARSGLRTLLRIHLPQIDLG